MKIVRHILSIVLVVLILFAGFPQFCPEDADRNSRIDLEDAIQNIRNLAQSADHPQDFTGSLGRAISTLTVLAGIKTVIKSDQKAKQTVHANLLNTPFLIAKNQEIKDSEHYIKMPPVFFLYISMDHIVNSPPPQVTPPAAC